MQQRRSEAQQSHGERREKTFFPPVMSSRSTDLLSTHLHQDARTLGRREGDFVHEVRDVPGRVREGEGGRGGGKEGGAKSLHQPVSESVSRSVHDLRPSATVVKWNSSKLVRVVKPEGVRTSTVAKQKYLLLYYYIA